MNGDITAVQVTMRLSGGQVARNHRGEEFVPYMLWHEAREWGRTVVLLGVDGTNVTLHPEFDDVSDWPAPPSWFETAAERLRLEAEELAAIRQERAS